MDNTACPMDYQEPAKCKRPRIWPIIDIPMHHKIKKLYQTKTGRSGEVEAFAKANGFPKWKIVRYAQTKAWVATGKKEPIWSKEEKALLRNNAQHGEEYILKVLKKAGFSRSIVGIGLKRRRMRYHLNLEGQTANMLSECFGVDRHRITKWIKEGLLKATRREQGQGKNNSFFIKDRDIKKFIVNNVNEIDIRVVDKYWFIEILAGSVY